MNQALPQLLRSRSPRDELPLEKVLQSTTEYRRGCLLDGLIEVHTDVRATEPTPTVTRAGGCQKEGHRKMEPKDGDVWDTIGVSGPSGLPGKVSTPFCVCSIVFSSPYCLCDHVHVAVVHPFLPSCCCCLCFLVDFVHHRIDPEEKDPRTSRK